MKIPSPLSRSVGLEQTENVMPDYNTLASKEAKRLGVSRTTLTTAIKNNVCAGEQRDGYWYTTSAAAAEWYKKHYRHASSLDNTMTGRRWDDDNILAMLDRGDSIDAIAKEFGRTLKATRVKIAHLRAAGKAPAAAEVKTVQRKKERIAEAKAILAEEEPQDWYKQRRQDEHDGRVRLHLHPDVKVAFEQELKRLNKGRGFEDRITLAKWVTWAGLAAIANPEILKKGLQEAERLGNK